MNLFEPLQVSPVTLEGPRVRLIPMAADHLDGLCDAGLYPELWRWIPTRVRDRNDMRAYIEEALRRQAEGQALPFVIEDRPSGKIAGSTRFETIDRINKHLEIGWTWSLLNGSALM